jgi:hypothetical protein
VDFYRVSTGEMMGYACSPNFVTHGSTRWRPAALRINRNDGLHYVSDAVGGGAIIRYPMVCVNTTTGEPNYEIVFQVADMRVEDIAFGDNRTMFVMTIDTLQSSPTFQLSKVYKMDLGGPTPGTLGTPVEIGNHETSAFDFQGIEADEDNNYFLTHRYSDRFGVPVDNCMSR